VTDYCEDCGKPATGHFDVVYHKVVNGIPQEEVTRIEKAKPLCAADAKSRGVK
jgi:hypothetical protein